MLLPIMKNMTLGCLLLLSTAVFAQHDKIENYKHVFRPDPILYLKGFIPNAATKLTNTEAEAMGDKIDLFNKGKVANYGISPDFNVYKVGNCLVILDLYADSLKWAIEKRIRPVELIQPNTDEYGVEVEEDKYEKRAPIIKSILDLETFAYYSSHAHYADVKRSYHQRVLAKQYMDVVLYYKTFQEFIQILGYDKHYQWEVRYAIKFKKTDRQEAINLANWIADHVDFDGEPIMGY